MKKKRVVEVGAGITGITCAYMLGKAGHEVFVYEKNEYPGGLASTFSHNGFSFDYGPHEFCTRNQELIKLIKDVLGDRLVIRDSNTSQYYNHKYIDYPLKPFQIIRVFSPVLLARIVLEVICQRLKGLVYSYENSSFEYWVRSRFGSTLYKTYFGPYTEKVFGIDPNSLDDRKASNRIAFNSIFDWIIKSFSYFFLRKDDYSTIHSPLKRQFYYSRGGISTISQLMAEKSEKMGVKYIYNQELKQIDPEREKLHFLSGYTHSGFDYLILTIPLPRSLHALGVREEIMPIKYRAIVFVFLEVPKRSVTPYTWIYFPDRDIIFQRITEFSNIEESMAPGGSSGLCLEISCFAGDDIWNKSDEKIVERVRCDLEKAGILDKSVPCNYHVHREPYSYPVQIAGYLEIVWELLSPFRKLKNVLTTGRQGLFKYCNMNECMEMAVEVARHVDSGVQGFKYTLDTNWKGAGLEEERIAASDALEKSGREKAS